MAISHITQFHAYARAMNGEETAEAVVLLNTACAFLEQGNTRSMEAEQFRGSIVANIREFLDALARECPDSQGTLALEPQQRRFLSVIT